MEREIPIRGQVIRLGQLLKLADVIASGAEVKTFLASEPVWINGEREARRGRQLVPGDVVRVGDLHLRLISLDRNGGLSAPADGRPHPAVGRRVRAVVSPPQGAPRRGAPVPRGSSPRHRRARRR